MDVNVYKEGQPYGRYFRKLYFEGVADGEAKGREAGVQEGLLKGLQEGRHEGLQEGRHEGFRQAIALVLVSRGLVPTPAQVERMARCTDEPQLQAWLRRACDVATVEALFEAHLPASMRSARRSARGGPASKAAAASPRRSR